MRLPLLLLACCVLSAAWSQSTPPRADPWRTGYSAADATAPHVLGFWRFEPGAEIRDASGKGHDLELMGAAAAADGRFGGGLRSFRGWPTEDKQHAAVAANSPSLSPAGAFTLDLWLRADPELAGYPDAFLVDKRYVANTDYQLILRAAEQGDRRRLTMTLGFGADSATWTSDAAGFAPGAWHHLAFTYDGKGAGRFYLDGRALGGETHPGRGAIVPGAHNLSLGDRVGSYYHGFPGVMDEVRLSSGVREFRPVAVSLVTERRAYRRLEAVRLQLAVANLQDKPLSTAKLTIGWPGLASQEFALPAVAAGATHLVSYLLDTSLRPGDYDLRATLALAGDEPYESTERFAISLAPRPLPHLMPVIMWGAGPEDAERLRDLGFTHCLGLDCDFDAIWKAGQPIAPASAAGLAANRAALDLALRRGLSVCAGLSPGSWARSLPEVARVGPDGKPYKEGDVCGLFQRVQDFCRDVGVAMAQAYGEYPAFEAAMVHTEVRDDTQLCFHDHDREAFRQATGLDIPAEATSKWGVQYDKLQDFPASRIIADEHPIYRYYQWFWREGDGWNKLHTELAQGLRSAGRKDFWTWFDPAARCPSIWGSGGGVDILSHWTYSYPDPIRIGTCTDELFAMAQGGPPEQKVMKMTQVIWYRSQTAPEPGETAAQQAATARDKDVAPGTRPGEKPAAPYQADWEIEQPDARFITIAPMHLREALWTKLARPIQGIMYHGWQSLVPVDPTGVYRHTNAATREELRRMVRTVIEPLGPTLTQLPDRKADVAFLESFASYVFAGRGTWGWSGGWAGDVYLMLMYAQLQTQIVYEDTVRKSGLDGFKVLVMPDCDVLPKSVAEAVLAWQKKGGLVVGDDRLAPGIKPDIAIKSFERPADAAEARKLLQQRAAELRKQLDKRYQRYGGSANPDIVTRFRQFAGTDYLFAINDRREFGDYVGHHKLVMESGLPADAELTVRRAAGHVYDLTTSRKVAATAAKGLLRWKDHFEPCSGHLYMVTGRPIERVVIAAPPSARRGEEITWLARVTDSRLRPVHAIVPVKVEMLDPAGEAAELSGYYGAKDGSLEVKLRLAPNDRPGLWELRVTELASGRQARHYLRVTTG